MNVRGERILIFGDSLTHHGSDNAPEVWNVNAGSGRTPSAPGDLLASLLLEAGAEAVRTDARVGRSAMNFYERENSLQLLANDLAWKPTKVVVMLGTNDIGRSVDGTRKAMTAIRDAFKAGGAEVWAIGPMLYTNQTPSFSHDAEIVRDTMKSVFGGRFIDAQPLTVDLVSTGRARDGVHFTAAGAQTLSVRLAQALLSKTSPTIWWTLAAVVGGAAAVGGIWWFAGNRLTSVSMSGSRTRNPVSSPGAKTKKPPKDALVYFVDPTDGEVVELDHRTAKYRRDGETGFRGVFSLNILRHENKWMKIGGDPKASGYKQIPCKSGLDKKDDPLFRVRCWSK